MEYEDRRDADDAYHDMHNKRIGRDDILKIEVCAGNKALNEAYTDSDCSGRVLRRLHRGASIAPTEIGIGGTAPVVLPRGAALPVQGAAPETIHRGRMIAATATTTVIDAILATVRAALTLGKLCTMLRPQAKY